ncbi:MAG: VOC family protein [Dehalococcoidia bacterium]|nr:VOC family protein [Dehalococcoidia bacterium]
MPEQQPVLNQLNLVVRDMAAALTFYQRLGLEVRDAGPEWAEWSPHHQTLVQPNGVHLDLDSEAFARWWNRGWPAGHGGGMGVPGFRVESREAVDRIYGELTSAGYRGQQEPYDAFWGARFAVVEDPDGNAVGLTSTLDDAWRTPPPDVSSFA